MRGEPINDDVPNHRRASRRCRLDHVVESTVRGSRTNVRSLFDTAPALRLAPAKVCPKSGFAIVIFVVLMMGIAIHQRWRGRGF